MKSPIQMAQEVRHKARFSMADNVKIFDVLERLHIPYVFTRNVEYKVKHDGRIYINRNMTDEEVRYAVAHALGHRYLHPGKEFCCKQFKESETEAELDANIFMCEFLMPYGEYREVFRSLSRTKEERDSLTVLPTVEARLFSTKKILGILPIPEDK